MGWLEATKKYARQRKGDVLRPSEVDDVIDTAMLLASFAKSQAGLASMLLLEASENVIACGQDETWVYCWAHFGPSKIPRSMFLSKLRRPHPATPTEVAKSLVRMRMRPADVLRWLRDEIDKVAIQAPE